MMHGIFAGLGGSYNIMLLLASKSPRRGELLSQIGVKFEVVEVDVPEHCLDGESPEHYVSRLAREKAICGWHNRHAAGVPVLGADTTVVLDGEAFGKPAGFDQAVEMLGRLSGRKHEVMSGVALMGDGYMGQKLQVSQVFFRELEEPEILAYCDSGEPYDKAGAYAVQGLAAIFIERLEGSYSGVMGLPLYETSQLLKEHRDRCE